MGLKRSIASLFLLVILVGLSGPTYADSNSSPVEVSPALQVGIGYPDIRVRCHLIGPVDGELKAAFSDGQQGYAGRLYWSAWGRGPLAVDLGLEGGALAFNDVETLSGTGAYGEPFLGLEYRFAKRWMVSADLGPAWIQVNSQGESLNEMQWVFNTALYFTIF